MEGLDIRYSKASDSAHLLKWLRDPDNNKWFPFSTEREVEFSVKNWSNFFKYRASLTGEINNQVCSMGTLFLMPYKKLSHLVMFYLIVDKDFRRKGVGGDMLKNLMNLAQNYFNLESIYGEVFEGCPIIGLLKKFKFNESAFQEYYVKEDEKYLSRILFDIWFK